MNARGIVDPRVLTGLARAHFRQTVTIQQATETQGSDGAPVATWANLASHVDLVGQVSPVTGQGSREQRTADQTYLQATHRIILAGPYTSITEKMRAVSGGRTYDILLVAQASQGDHTELICELVE